MSARSKARKRALDFLYEAEIKKISAMSLFSARDSSELSQEPYVKVLLSGVEEHIQKIIKHLDRYIDRKD